MKMKMFKHIVHIISYSLMLILFSCAGESRQEDFAAAPVEESRSISQAEFTENITELPESLTEDQQNAYQLRAKQKFQDFLDYLKIISNPKIDDGLIKHSKKLMKELFISDSVNFYSSDSLNITGAKIKSLAFIKPLKYDSLNNYLSGALQINMMLHKQKTNKTIEVYLVETTKQFGDEEQKTIEIKLGNMY